MLSGYAIDSLEIRRGNGFLLQIEQLEIHAGGLVALVGPNGSGKSTLLEALAFLLPAEAGKVRLLGEGGEEVMSSDRLRSMVTLVQQDPYLIHGSVRANVELGLRIRRSSHKKRLQAVAVALKVVGLAGFEEYDVQSLSIGQKRRVALARALVLETGVVLLDEPFANLDSASCFALETVLTQLAGQGRTVMFATHDQAQATRLESSVVKLDEGTVDAVFGPKVKYCSNGKEVDSWQSPLMRPETSS